MKLTTHVLAHAGGLLLVLACGSAKATTPAAAAAPFTLRVPLEVSNLHERISKILIRCDVHAPRGLYEATGFSATTRVFVLVDRTTGRPMEPVAVVPLVLPAGKDPRSVTSYRCDMESVIDSSYVTPAPGTTLPHHYDASKPFQATVRGQISAP